MTTYEPYSEETSYENSLLVQQSGVLALSSMTHIMRSLTPNAKGIFFLLVRYQLENKDNQTYQGKPGQGTGPRLNIKTVFPRYGDSHVKDKTVVRPFYL